MVRRLLFLILLPTLLVVLVVFAAASEVLVDWLWFDALGFGAVFITMWKAKLVVFSVTLLMAGGALALNGLLAVRATSPRVRRLQLVRSPDNNEGFADLFDPFSGRFPWRASVLGFAIVGGLVFGLVEAANWELFLKWRYAAPFGRIDPVLGHDLGFYVFSLPVYATGRNVALFLVVFAVISAASVYGARGAIEATQGGLQVSAAVVRHLSVLLALFFLAKASDYFLQRYALLRGDNGIVFGAAYTDIHVSLPFLTILTGL
jgi:uncharacterized membrane protein (UPF0182 family)